MDDKTTTFGLSPEKIAYLLNMAQEQDKNSGELSPDEEKSDILKDQLAEKLLFDPEMEKLIPVISAHLDQAMEPLNQKIDFLLKDPNTDISILRRIKIHYNRKTTHSEDKNERDIAIVLYYAAIASALVYQDTKISKFSYQDMQKSFDTLNTKSWISPWISELFTKASEKCRIALMVKDEIKEDDNNPEESLE